MQPFKIPVVLVNITHYTK